MADALLSITDSSGTPITNTYEIFSGSVYAGSGVYNGTIRVYNNIDAVSGVAHARDVRLYMSPSSGVLGYNGAMGEYDEDITTIPFVHDTLSGSCTYSAKTDAAVSGTLQSLSVGIYGTDYNEIYASGSNNYNEYDLQISIPSGVNILTLSGSIYLAVEYKTFLV
jgi:hypothetical protein